MCYNIQRNPGDRPGSPDGDARVVRFAVAQHGVGTRRHAFLLRGTGRRATRPALYAGQPQGEEAPLRDLNRAPRTYEMMTILHPDVSEEEIQPALDRVSGYITTAGGEVTETLRDSPWGRRRLAYPIRFAGRDLRDGYYSVFHFSLAPAQIVEMERELKLNTQIIRYLVVSWEPKPLAPEEIEAAEIAAEEAAAAAYAAAQAAAQAAAGAQTAESTATDANERAEALTAEAEAAEASGAELSIATVETESGAIEPVAALEARAELEVEAAVALGKAAAAAAGETSSATAAPGAEGASGEGSTQAEGPQEATGA